LFNFYTSDLSNHLDSKYFKYVDDILIIRPIYDISDVRTLNSDLDSLASFFNQKGLKPNPSKFVHLRFTNKKVLKSFIPNSYKFEDIVIPLLHKHIHLGLAINDQLSFDDHYNTLVLKARRKWFFIKKLCKYSDKQSLIVLYKTYIRPIVECLNIVIEPNCGQSKSIENVQKYILRDIDRDFSKSYATLLKAYGVESMKTRREIRLLKIVINIRNATNKASRHFSKYITFKNGGITNRRGIELEEQYIHLKKFITFKQCVPKIFNKLPNSIRTNYDFNDCLKQILDFYGSSYV